jgi:sn-glycerol 3-phosphate transport system ATP-binding protein
MNLLRVNGGRIAGSDVEAGPGAWLGVRPEAITLGANVPATVRSCEYLGADLVLHCAIGSESLTVRTGGEADIEPGREVRLDWAPAAAHHFDSQGQRI